MYFPIQKAEIYQVKDGPGPFIVWAALSDPEFCGWMSEKPYDHWAEETT